MTVKKIFQEILSIKDIDARAERLKELAEQDADVAAKVITLLRNSDEFQPVLDNPLIFLNSPDVKHQTARYSVTSELAKGGMGGIYAAYDSQMRRDVVLKCLLPKHQNNFQAVQRFYNEAHITGQLQHPGIAPVYEVGELEDGRPFYCMKLVEGKTLAQFLAERGSPSVDKAQALNLFLQTCQTMAFAHEHGILHRDLKPSNIMIGKHGQIQIMDWGVAKRLPTTGEPSAFESVGRQQADTDDNALPFDHADTEDVIPDLTRHGQIIGTPGYMSPEQASGQNHRVDKPTDVYALGAILYEILTGVSLSKIKTNSNDQAEPKLDAWDDELLNSTADFEMTELARSCLQRAPDNRPQNADAVAQVVLAHFASREAVARKTQIELEKELTKSDETRKRRRLITNCALACLGLLVAGIVGTSIGFYKENVARTLADEQAKDARIAEELAITARTAADDSKAKAEARLEQLKKGNEILGSVFENLHPQQSAISGKPLLNLLVDNLDNAAAQLEGESIGAPDVVASFQMQIGKCYAALGFDEKAILLFEKAHVFAGNEYGIENEFTLNAQFRLAQALTASHQAERAKPYLLELQEFYIRNKKTDAPQFFRVQFQLASFYAAKGEFKKSLKLIESHSEKGLEILSVEYVPHLAQAYLVNDMPNKAIEVLRSELSRIEKTASLSETKDLESRKLDLGRQIVQMLLARSYLQLDQPRKAIPLLEKLFPDLQSRYGNSPSPRLFNVAYSFGMALQRVGRHRDSIKYFFTCTQLTEAKSGSLSKSKVFPLYWLVEAYLKTGEYSKALEIAHDIHNQQTASHGTNHLETSLSAERLADIYLLINQPEKAKEYLDSAYGDHEFRGGLKKRQLGRKEFKLAIVAANQDKFQRAIEEFETAREVLGEWVARKPNHAYPIFFDYLEPQIWLAESLALQGDENAISSIEDFESEMKKNLERLDELIAPAQQLYRACVARYAIKADETLLARLKEVIEILEKEHLEGTQAHLLEDARSLLGMVYLQLGETTDAKSLLESSYSSLMSIENPSPPTAQAIVDAATRVRHFYLTTDATDAAQRVSDSIKTIESNTDRIPSFRRALIDKTLTTVSKQDIQPGQSQP